MGHWVDARAQALALVGPGIAMPLATLVTTITF